MNKEVNENWIDIYIKNKPFSYKGSIIAHCRKMDKADVYEWIAEDELKICQLKQKVNQLETNRDELKKWLKEIQQEEFDINGFTGVCTEIRIECILDKIEELEEGK